VRDHGSEDEERKHCRMRCVSGSKGSPLVLNARGGGYFDWRIADRADIMRLFLRWTSLASRYHCGEHLPRLIGFFAIPIAVAVDAHEEKIKSKLGQPCR
jgi:hypothetical protein